MSEEAKDCTDDPTTEPNKEKEENGLSKPDEEEVKPPPPKDDQHAEITNELVSTGIAIAEGGTSETNIAENNQSSEVVTNEQQDDDTPLPSAGKDGDEKIDEDNIGNEVQTGTESAAETTTQAGADPDSIGNSQGAKIIMNRFSSWKQSANEGAQTIWKSAVIPENAKTLWKQKPNITSSMPRLQTRIFAAGEKQPSSEAGGGAAPITEKLSLSPADAKEVNSKQSSSLADSSIGDESDEVSSDGDGGLNKNDDNNDRAEEIVANDTDVSSSSEQQVESRIRVGAAISKASTAASVVAESVATGFRGRYSARAAVPQTPPATGGEPSLKPSPESQTELILKSRAGKHMEEILDSLDDQEFAMLLGTGMLGVNLKQCYLKNHGVFVDFLVVGGQAEASGIVRSGDLVVRIGDVDLRKGTILEIPREIAKARRPVILILSTGTKVSLERMNYIDVSVAMMHRARDYYYKRGTLFSLPTASITDAVNGSDGVSTGDQIRSVCEIEVPLENSTDCFVTPPVPTLELRKEFMEGVTLRAFDKFILSDLCEVCSSDSNFRAALRNAFLTCAIDSRRLPFLARHLSREEELPEGSHHGNMAPSAQLMLFLELTSFLDLYGVAPVLRLKENASRIAYKFFLPTQIGQNLQPPLFDFHNIVPDSSLRHLEFVLNASVKKNSAIPRDVFLDFQKAVADSLSIGPFISFLVSAECARMRAYLRNTAPYAPVPLRELVDAVVGDAKHAVATKNAFVYILLFLICQVQNEPNGEHNFATNEENGRIVGAPDGLCCFIFIKRSLLPTILEAKAKLDAVKPDEDLDPVLARKVLSTCEKFWDTYANGSLDSLSKRSDIETCYIQVRSELETVVTEIMKAGHPEASRKSIEVIVKSKIIEKSERLAEELLYNYAANVNTKFREHKFHEWMCSELSKVRAVNPNYTNKEDLPTLPQGCVKRLLRKADLPDGVSTHKPFKAPTKDSDNERNYPNAELAVIFGSTVGTDMASQMPIPGIENTDIRRYACLPIALDRESDFASGENLPPTFESYAVVPPLKKKPFGQLVDAARTRESEICERPSIKTVFCKAESQNTPETANIATTKSGLKSPVTFASASASGVESTSSDSNNEKREYARNVQVASDFSEFNKKMDDGLWVDRVSQDEYRDQSKPISIGLALVSNRNVILAMRDTLNMLLFDYSRVPEGENTSPGASLNCSTLVNVLGTFAHKDIESGALKQILSPYLRASSSPWIDRPVHEQSQAFESVALQQLSDCLPPTPLALMFVTALLEQKIVLSSTRRSILHASTAGLASLLRPLSWSHLLVPLVPGALAGDLIQYPAPFILGIPSEDDENRDHLGNLPNDVTLIDLDVGRVILAPAFGRDNEMVRRSSDSEATANALRSQVLYLAQAVGGIFGNKLRPKTWCCDSPLRSDTSEGATGAGVKSLKSVAGSFVHELLEGVTSCCYWVEEVTQSYGGTAEPTVLFDEDKFFEMKNQRAKRTCKPLFGTERSDELALNLEDFDLVLESFLRCQSVSTYISSRPKTDMLYF